MGTLFLCPSLGMRTFKITYARDSEGGWRASVYAVPGCHAEGDTQEEARKAVLAAFLELQGDEEAEFTEEVR